MDDSKSERKGQDATASRGRLPLDPRADGLAERLLEAAPDAIIGVGEDGRIAFANPRTEALFGHSRDELLGESIEVLVPERLRQAHTRHRAEYTAARVPARWAPG